MVEINLDQRNEPKERIHFGWMTGLILSGVALGAAAFFIGPLFASDDVQNPPIWQSILTNFGTGLVSAGLLLLVEPKVRRAVKSSVANATKDANANFREDLRKDVQGDIDEKFASLEQRIESSIGKAMSEQDSLLEDFADGFDYQSAHAALTHATEILSIHNHELIVQASELPGELRIGLRLALPEGLRSHGRFDSSPYTLDDEVVFLTARTNKSRYEVAVQWKFFEDFGDASTNLMKELTRSGAWGMGRSIDWKAVTKRLAKGLKFALDSRRQVPGTVHLPGSLIEVMGSDEDSWYLTDKVLACPNRKFSLAQKDIRKSPNPAALPPQERLAAATATKPDFVDQDVWDYAFHRAKEELIDPFS